MRYYYVRWALSLVLLLGVGNVGKAQDFGAYHIGRRFLQGANVNATFLNENHTNFALPLNINLTGNVGMSLSDVFIKNKETDKLELNTQRIGENIKEGHWVLSNATVNLLGFSTHRGANTFSFHYNIRSNVGLRFGKDMGRLIKVGLVDDTSVRIKGSANVYHELALGFKRQFNDKLAVAVRLKYLNGLIHYSARGGLDIKINQDDYTWTVSNLPNTYLKTNLPKSGDNDVLNFTHNHGFAADVAASYQIDDKWDVSLAVNDVGFISWVETPKVNDLKEVKDKNYRGINLESGSLGNVTTTVQDLFGYSSEADEGSFQQMLALSSYLSVRYQLNKVHSFQAVAHHRLESVSTSFSLGYQLNGKTAGVGLYGIYHDNNNKFSLGANLHFQTGALQWYVMGENLLNIGNIDGINSVNLGFGLNIVIKKPRRVAKNGAIFDF